MTLMMNHVSKDPATVTGGLRNVIHNENNVGGHGAKTLLKLRQCAEK